MALIIKEIRAKSILSKSKVYPYVINAYVGRQHGCAYCYARFMKRVTGHKEPWGEFVDVKINAAKLALLELVMRLDVQVALPHMGTITVDIWARRQDEGKVGERN